MCAGGACRYIVTRNLNRVIDNNFYPVEEARNSNMKHRPIGLGVQGLADAFIHMRLPFDSDGAPLVRGEDHHGHWGWDPEPVEDHDTTCLAALAEIHARYRSAADQKVVAGVKQ